MQKKVFYAIKKIMNIERKNEVYVGNLCCMDVFINEYSKRNFNTNIQLKQAIREPKGLKGSTPPARHNR